MSSEHKVASASVEHHSHEPVYFFSDDEHNALVVTVLLERHGLPVRWITSETFSVYLPKLERGLIIYDVASAAEADRCRSYFEQVSRLPCSTVLVGLGEAQGVPMVFADLCSRTVTFLAKPFNVSDAIRVLELLTDNANDTPI